MMSGRTGLTAGQPLPRRIVCGAWGLVDLVFSMGVCGLGAEEGRGASSLSDLSLCFRGSVCLAEELGDVGSVSLSCVCPSPHPILCCGIFLS